VRKEPFFHDDPGNEKNLMRYVSAQFIYVLSELL